MIFHSDEASSVVDTTNTIRLTMTYGVSVSVVELEGGGSVINGATPSSPRTFTIQHFKCNVRCPPVQPSYCSAVLLFYSYTVSMLCDCIVKEDPC